MCHFILESCVEVVEVKLCFFSTRILAESTVFPLVSSKLNKTDTFPVTSAASLRFVKVKAVNSPSVSLLIANTEVATNDSSLCI